MMEGKAVRNWIGKYFLFTLAFFGGYIYLFAETPLLPLNRNEALAAGETIIPVFLGQVAIMYRWFFSIESKDTAENFRIPSWVVKGPPLITIVLLTLCIMSMIISNAYDGIWAPDPDGFRKIVVFTVSLLNVTSVFVISRYFGEMQK